MKITIAECHYTPETLPAKRVAAATTVAYQWGTVRDSLSGVSKTVKELKMQPLIAFGLMVSQEKTEKDPTERAECILLNLCRLYLMKMLRQAENKSP